MLSVTLNETESFDYYKGVGTVSTRLRLCFKNWSNFKKYFLPKYSKCIVNNQYGPGTNHWEWAPAMLEQSPGGHLLCLLATETCRVGGGGRDYREVRVACHWLAVDGSSILKADGCCQPIQTCIDILTTYLADKAAWKAWAKERVLPPNTF